MATSLHMHEDGRSDVLMGRLEFASPRAAWGGEASSFTPLLADEELLEYLGDETGIGRLSPLDVEHRVGNRYVDILAETGDGRLVVIENQYGRADHDHLTRALAYAVALGAAAVVLVAEEHRDEFVSVADYLNDVGGRASTGGISVWLIRVRAVRRIGDQIWSPEFVVQARPNDWESAVRRSAPGVFGALTDFYDECANDAGPAWAHVARSVIEEWLDRPGATEGHATQQTVSLFYPAPRRRAGSNVLQLAVNGAIYVVRGYIWQASGVFDPNADPEDLDGQIRTHFPEAKWGPRGHSVSVFGADVPQIRAFLDWIVARYDECPAQ